MSKKKRNKNKSRLVQPDNAVDFNIVTSRSQAIQFQFHQLRPTTGGGVEVIRRPDRIDIIDSDRVLTAGGNVQLMEPMDIVVDLNPNRVLTFSNSASSISMFVGSVSGSAWAAGGSQAWQFRAPERRVAAEVDPTASQEYMDLFL